MQEPAETWGERRARMWVESGKLIVGDGDLTARPVVWAGQTIGPVPVGSDEEDGLTESNPTEEQIRNAHTNLQNASRAKAGDAAFRRHMDECHSHWRGEIGSAGLGTSAKPIARPKVPNPDLPPGAIPRHV